LKASSIEGFHPWSSSHIAWSIWLSFQGENKSEIAIILKWTNTMDLFRKSNVTYMPSLSFMEPESSLPLSQQTAIGRYPQSDRSSPHATSLSSILILSSLLYLDLPSGLFHSGFPIEIQWSLLQTLVWSIIMFGETKIFKSLLS
jgi:hypothetical protein